MRIFNTENGFAPVGSGYLYAALAKDFTEDYSLDDMDDLGYIKDGESFKLTSTPIINKYKSANKGAVGTVVTGYDTSCETGIISFNPAYVAKYLTGGDVEQVTVGTKKGTRLYGNSDAQRPEVFLVFVGTDKTTGQEARIVMPKCVWTSDFELEFNAEDITALNYGFDCLDVTLSDGRQITHWTDWLGDDVTE